MFGRSLINFALVILFSSACIPRKSYEQKTIAAREDGYRDAAAQCHREAEVVLDKIEQQETVLSQYRDRLTKLNQFNQDLTLIKLDPCIENPADPKCNKKPINKKKKAK